MLSGPWQLMKHLILQQKSGMNWAFLLILLTWGSEKRRHGTIAAVSARPLLPSKAIATTSTNSMGNSFPLSLRLQKATCRRGLLSKKLCQSLRKMAGALLLLLSAFGRVRGIGTL